MGTICQKCEILIAEHSLAVFDLSRATEAVTDLARADSDKFDAAWAKVLLVGERCVNLRAVISAHIAEHARGGNLIAER
jgi:hypothetical protein